jgi:hypothetical protein
MAFSSDVASILQLSALSTKMDILGKNLTYTSKTAYTTTQN